MDQSIFRRCNLLPLALGIIMMSLTACGGGDGSGGQENTTGTITIPAVNVNGDGSNRIGEIALTDGWGTIEIHGQHIPSLVYKLTEWTDYDYTLLHIIAPQQDLLHILYLYIRDGVLVWVWHESYDDELDYELGVGSFSSNGNAIIATPALNLLDATPNIENLVTGVDINGSAIQYDGSGPGLITLGAQTLDLYPFQYVDCSDCGSGGWYELHSVMEDPSGRLCFGILYLMSNHLERVWLNYGIYLDTAQAMDSEYITATWSVDAIIAAMNNDVDLASESPVLPFRPGPVLP